MNQYALKPCIFIPWVVEGVGGVLRSGNEVAEGARRQETELVTLNEQPLPNPWHGTFRRPNAMTSATRAPSTPPHWPRPRADCIPRNFILLFTKSSQYLTPKPERMWNQRAPAGLGHAIQSATHVVGHSSYFGVYGAWSNSLAL